MSLIRNDLAEVANSWNSHRLRNMPAADCPSGVPNFLYSVPQFHGHSNEGKAPTQDVLLDPHVRAQCVDPQSVPDFSDDIEQYAHSLIQSNPHYKYPPATRAEALDLYGHGHLLLGMASQT